MITPMNAGLSGVAAFSTRMSVTANNIANVNTDDFKKSRTLLSEGPIGGVEATVERVDSPGYPKSVSRESQIETVESSNVDIAEELTDTISTKTGYEANLKTIQAYDDMLGTLLDTIG